MKRMIGDIKSRLGIIGELMSFLWHQKLWWLIPMVVILLLLSLFFVFTQATVIAPFIYALF